MSLWVYKIKVIFNQARSFLPAHHARLTDFYISTFFSTKRIDTHTRGWSCIYLKVRSISYRITCHTSHSKFQVSVSASSCINDVRLNVCDDYGSFPVNCIFNSFCEMNITAPDPTAAETWSGDVRSEKTLAIPKILACNIQIKRYSCKRIRFRLCEHTCKIL